MSQLKQDASQIRGRGQADAGAQPAPEAAAPARGPHKSPVPRSKAPSREAAAGQAPMLGVVPIEQLVAAQRAQMEALTKATNVLVEGLTAINREVADFSDRRARAILDVSQAAPKTGDWSEMWSFQIDYAGHATQDYMEEATKLFDLGLKVSQESWMPLQESVTTAFNGIFRKPD